MSMSRRALVIGINHYDHFSPLTGCVPDANAMADVLSRNADGSVNFECRVLVSPGPVPITRALLRQQWRELFFDLKEDVLFYFSRHRTPTEGGGDLAKLDGMRREPVLPVV